MRRPVALLRVNRVEPDGTVVIHWAGFPIIFAFLTALNLAARAIVHAVQGGKPLLDTGDIFSACLLSTGITAFALWSAWKETKE